MATIFERVETALGTISPAVPFALAPYKDTLPDAYITHQLLPSSAAQHADNVESERLFTVQISMWSKAGIPSESSVDTAMLAAGFQKGDIRQLPQDQQTDHYGLAIEYVYLETKE
jgi:hypothetical protein